MLLLYNNTMIVLFTGCTGQDNTFIENPSDATILTNQPYLISCLISNPPAVMIWIKDQEQRETNFDDPRIQITYNSTTGLSTHYITNVVYADAGNYQCQALSENGQLISFSNIATITVTGLPAFGSLLQPVSTTVGNSVSFSCTVDANPTPTISWAFNTQTLSSEGQYSISTVPSGGVMTVSTLLISNVQLSNNGFYRCSATNSFGKNSTAAKLTVTGRSY